jgi:hypothetical protein
MVKIGESWTVRWPGTNGPEFGPRIPEKLAEKWPIGAKKDGSCGALEELGKGILQGGQRWIMAVMVLGKVEGQGNFRGEKLDGWLAFVDLRHDPRGARILGRAASIGKKAAEQVVEGKVSGPQDLDEHGRRGGFPMAPHHGYHPFLPQNFPQKISPGPGGYVALPGPFQQRIPLPKCRCVDENIAGRELGGPGGHVDALAQEQQLHPGVGKIVESPDFVSTLCQVDGQGGHACATNSAHKNLPSPPIHGNL